jgi:hypothetical protein
LPFLAFLHVVAEFPLNLKVIQGVLQFDHGDAKAQGSSRT